MHSEATGVHLSPAAITGNDHVRFRAALQGAGLHKVLVGAVRRGN